MKKIEPKWKKDKPYILVSIFFAFPCITLFMGYGMYSLMMWQGMPLFFSVFFSSYQSLIVFLYLFIQILETYIAERVKNEH